LGGLLLTANDAVLKWLTGDYPVGQVLFFRGLFVLAAISIIVRGLRVRDQKFDRFHPTTILRR